MEPCEDIPPAPALTSLASEAQARSVTDYILILYSRIKNCSEKQKELTNWIGENTK